MNDDELLQQLADALAPEPCVPPAAGLQALHRSIDAATRSARPQRRRLRRRWLLPAVAAVSALGVCNLALAAAGTSLPRVVRTAAHELNLPVDSPALLDTRHHRDALRAALDRNDPAAIETQARQLRAAFVGLDNGERNTITADVEQLLARADNTLDTSTTATDADDATATTRPSPTTSATTTVADSQRRTANTNPNTDGQVPGPSSGANNIDTSTTENNINSETTQNNSNSNTGQDTGSNQSNGGDLNVDNNQPDPNP